MRQIEQQLEALVSPPIAQHSCYPKPISYATLTQQTTPWANSQRALSRYTCRNSFSEGSCHQLGGWRCLRIGRHMLGHFDIDPEARLRKSFMSGLLPPHKVVLVSWETTMKRSNSLDARPRRRKTPQQPATAYTRDARNYELRFRLRLCFFARRCRRGVGHNMRDVTGSEAVASLHRVTEKSAN